MHGVSESNGTEDVCETAMKKVAEELKVQLDNYNLQKCHRLGKKKSPKAKPLLIKVRFVSYKKRMEFLKAKSRLKKINNKLLKHRPSVIGGHTGAVPPQLTACAPQTKIVPPQARTVPRRN